MVVYNASKCQNMAPSTTTKNLHANWFSVFPERNINWMGFVKLQTCFSTCLKTPTSQLLGSVPECHTYPGERERTMRLTTDFLQQA